MNNLRLHNLSDEQVLSIYGSTQDSACIGELIKRYRHLVFGVCVKYLKNKTEAEDATNEVFEKILFEPDLSVINAFHAWIYVVAKNHCLGILRKKGKSFVSENELRQLSEPNECSVFENKGLTEENLSHALKLLNSAQALCVKLFYLEEKSYQEVSAMSGYSLNEVKSHLQNARRNLKNILSKLAS
jgi:RNA polymerase sigma-70 factor (ECF subfamily)